MPSQEEINDLLARNPCAQWLHDKAQNAMAEAATSIPDPNAAPTVHELMRRILNVPRSAFHRNRKSSNKSPGTVKFTNRSIVKVIGSEHFEPEQEGFRRVLRNESKLKTHGVQAGLPQGLYNWLVDAGGNRGRET